MLLPVFMVHRIIKNSVVSICFFSDSLRRCRLDSYTEFSRLSLQVSEIDELSWGLLFTKDLHSDIKRHVLTAHPVTLAQAIRSAHTAQQVAGVTEDDRQDGNGTQPLRRFRASSDGDTPRLQSRNPAPGKHFLSKLSEQERQHLQQSGGCFACRQPGHIAKDCTKYPNDLRQ